MSFFERYLTVWVGLCIVLGIALGQLAARSDVVTLDIEAVSAASLSALEGAKVAVAPSSKVLGIIQDKLLQKEFLTAAGLPAGEFRDIDSPAALRALLQVSGRVSPSAERAHALR